MKGWWLMIEILQTDFWMTIIMYKSCLIFNQNISHYELMIFSSTFWIAFDDTIKLSFSSIVAAIYPGFDFFVPFGSKDY